MAGVSPSRTSGGARSAIRAFCRRWTSSRRSAAIVSSGESSEAAISTSPVANDAIRHPPGRSRRAAQTYADAAAAVSTRYAGSKEKRYGLTPREVSPHGNRRRGLRVTEARGALPRAPAAGERRSRRRDARVQARAEQEVREHAQRDELLDHHHHARQLLVELPGVD